LRAVINPLKNNYLLRTAWIAWATAMLACGGRRHRQEATPPPTAPLPTAGLAGQRVSVLPLTLVAAEDSLHWEHFLANRGAALAQADSVIGTLLMARAPEVTWVLPDELRRATRRAPGIAPVPDQMGTAILRSESIQLVPDPLRSELRTLVALAGTGGGGGGGGRYALVPAALVFRRTAGPPDRRTVTSADRPTAGPPDQMAATAELSVVMVDVRTGQIGFRTVARGDGDDPWTALTRAVKSLTPGLP
jgi:hypothetical protein